MKKKNRIAVVMLAALLLLTVLLSACSKADKDPMNPVVMKLGDLKLTKFIFDSLYATNSNYYKMSQGAISMSDYFDLVTDDMGRYAVTLKEARDKGFELTEEDEANISTDCEAQWEHIKGLFMEKIDSSITDPDQIAEEFERRFKIDTGYSSEVYKTNLEQSLRDRELIQKLFESMTDDMEPSDADVKNYLELQVNNESQAGFATFAERFRKFVEEEGDPFTFVPDNCFTVDQYLIGLENDADARTQELDSRFETGISSEEFLELISSDANDDANMKNERYFKTGYLIHKTVAGNYTEEFYYASCAANGQKIVSGLDADMMRNAVTLNTSDGKTVIKIADADGYHYVMVVKEYLKGEVRYEKGDDVWNFGYEGAKSTIRQKHFDDTVEEWYQNAKSSKKIKWYFDRFKDKYLPGSFDY